MVEKKRVLVLLLLLGPLGCHQEQPEAVERARLEQLHAKDFYTDRASLVYAQQELSLADVKAAAGPATLPGERDAELAASDHVTQAELKLKLDADTLQLDEDRASWSSLARTLAESQVHEVQP